MTARGPFVLAETYATRRGFRFRGIEYRPGSKFPKNGTDVSERRQQQLWEAGNLRLPVADEKLTEGIDVVAENLPGTPDRVVDPLPKGKVESTPAIVTKLKGNVYEITHGPEGATKVKRKKEEIAEYLRDHNLYEADEDGH